MKKAFLIFSLLFFVNSVCSAQDAGNRVYGNRNSQNNKRQPAMNSDNLRTGNDRIDYAIEANVLLNLKPDSFVTVFGVAQEAKNAEESNNKVNLQIDGFLKNLSGLGISKNDIYIDFITQNRVYDFEVAGDIARQILAGFETKKTVAVKYKDRESFEKVLTAATKTQIFDLIKVDYIVGDFDSVRDRLFDEAVKVVKKKEAKYKESFGADIKSIGLAIEKYDAFYPAERYESYQAFESGSATTTNYRDSKTYINLRKSATFFYEPLNGIGFDKVINPIGIEPTVQFTLHLRVDYDLLRKRVNQN